MNQSAQCALFSLNCDPEGEDDTPLTFVVPGEPRSKSRHKPGIRGGKLPQFKDAGAISPQEEVRNYYKQDRGPGEADALSGFGVSMAFYLGARQRRDVDNMVKLILDSLTGQAWVDDSQVTEISAKVRHGDPNPRTEVTVYRTDDLPDWMRATCQWCQQKFRTYNSWFGREYCSRTCYSAALRQKRLRPCDHCSNMYDAYNKAKSQRYCSAECRTAAKTYGACCANCGRVWRKPVSLRRGVRDYCDKDCSAAYWRAHPTKSAKGGQCEICGSPKSRPEYLRCNSCKRANQKPKSIAAASETS